MCTQTRLQRLAAGCLAQCGGRLPPSMAAHAQLAPPPALQSGRVIGPRCRCTLAQKKDRPLPLLVHLAFAPPQVPHPPAPAAMHQWRYGVGHTNTAGSCPVHPGSCADACWLLSLPLPLLLLHRCRHRCHHLQSEAQSREHVRSCHTARALPVQPPAQREHLVAGGVQAYVQHAQQMLVSQY